MPTLLDDLGGRPVYHESDKTRMTLVISAGRACSDA